MRTLLIAFGAFVAAAVWVGAQPGTSAPSIVGTWTLDEHLSDRPETRMPARGQGQGRGPGGGGFGRGGRGGGIGGFGGGPGGRIGRSNPEEMDRRQEALRGIIEAPERLTIVDTGSLIIITTNDGRTTRLSADGQKIKDESTNVERKTSWQAGKLVSEISGALGKITEIYSADPGHRELMVILQIEGSGRDEPARVIHRIYKADAR